MIATLEWQQKPVTDDVRAAAGSAGRDAQAHVAGRLRALFDADIDAQATTPLSILRDAVSFPTAVLRQAGADAVRRDMYAVEAFPDDEFALTPASLADVSEDLVELGIRWGAAKAWAHKERHGS
ncbi:MAG: hypothetical protein JOZ37_18535 [Actinobacteria bacterium]|nr:hypothetical protein [Actinomycetota bacterium]MBV9252841.1 hypothetical protein [Actinomycetota bacterium]MBV9665968.1 hypothetical protein [Actinomycetota bacterium]MBV9935998.1 hypothetical protein [Actinomycetota bacterium]